ncbi:hypothetical protein I551_6975 [Mycobacterium ulcerans str. Harvey]|uniref:Transposase n=1 Tax=Mycobacterium ulcerans str. Harvey TaxID=1299332 RepID=A0ABN0QPD7_MYCUL|nr:hypothetical protein I551_6975 [Mycobacterium ulcerans str. Harvey]
MANLGWTKQMAELSVRLRMPGNKALPRKPGKPVINTLIAALLATY